MTAGKDERDFMAELDGIGEDQVRQNIAMGVYGTGKRRLTELWLERKNRERADSQRAEDIEVARRASEAAERAASAAERDASAAERAAEAAERAADAAEESNQNAATAKWIAMAMMIITALGILANVFLS
jgi:hypothetical protein